MSTTYRDLASKLRDQGATIFACGAYRPKEKGAEEHEWDPKVPARSGWQKGCTLAEVTKHIERSEPGKITHIGLIPHSIGCLIVDVDSEAENAVQRVIDLIGEPVHIYQTSPETHPWKHHLCYPDGGVKHRNLAIYLEGEEKRIGELRGATGYIRIPRTEDAIKIGDFKAMSAGADPVDVSELLKKPSKTPSNGDSGDMWANAPEGADWSQGARNDTLNRLAFNAFRRGRPDEAELALQKALDSGLPWNEAKATFDSAKAGGEAAKAKAAPKRQARTAGDILERLNKNYMAWLWDGHPPVKKGSPEAKAAYKNLKETKAKLYAGCTMYGLQAVLAILRVEVRHNIRKDAVEWRFGGEGVLEWRELNDRNESVMREFIRQAFSFAFTKETAHGEKEVVIPWPSAKAETWRRAMQAILALQEKDPFLEWLNTLPKWDGKPRISTLLHDLFCATPTPLNAWASSYLFMGAVKRTLKPAHKLDVVPVLIGPQGIGKSSFLRSLLPDDEYCDAWFNDGVALHDKPQALVEGVAGTVIVELAEMAGATKADLDRMKAFISRTNDGHVRSAYAHRAEDRPRRFILTATADRMDSLPQDSQGLRRFCPVVLPNKAANGRKLVSDARAQLWAEALHRVRQGEPVHLHGELETESAANAIKFMANDEALEGQIQKCTKRAAPGCHIPISTIVMAVNFDVPHGRIEDTDRTRLPRFRFTSEQVRSALRRFGWAPKVKKIDGKAVRGWSPPEGWVE